MNNISIIGVDLAKHVFQLHGVDARGNALFSKKVSRHKLLSTLAQLSPCLVAMEACGGAHHWAREIGELGHEAQLLPPQYVKPFVLGHKSDARDAAAIAEAAARPSTPRVAIKSTAQQALQALHRVRSRTVADRTAMGNELRGLLGEMGIIIAQGHAILRQGGLRERLSENRATLGEPLYWLLDDLLDQWLTLDARIKRYDRQLEAQAKASPVCQRLMSIPGIGPINATLLASHAGDPRRFPNGRQFSASLGLVPRQYSSGGKERLLGITKRGNSEVRRQLVHGARAALRGFQTQETDDRLGRWVQSVAARRGQHKAIVALANKLARICWAVMVHERPYQAQA